MEVGGQAVIEGVMMRNKEQFAVAVRLPDGRIKVKKEKNSNFPKPFDFFFVRGIIGLWYTLYDGIRAIIWSSNQNLGTEEKLSSKEVISVIFVSVIVSMIIFIAVPFFSAQLINSEGFLFNLLEGLFRIILFVGYLFLISLMKDVRTLFQYHGAEHKVIACYENKQKLTIDNVKKFSRFHPRCGTSFLFIVLLLSVFIFALIPGSWWVKLLGRVILLPVIAGMGYEIIKLSSKYRSKAVVKVLIAPGLWLQGITTNEPSPKQLEVGIKSLQAVVK